MQWGWVQVAKFCYLQQITSNSSNLSKSGKSPFRLKNMQVGYIIIIAIFKSHNGRFRQNSHLLA